ncbi:MAG: TolC family protein, partial [Synergistetes bacterium]|nr:TolC family protein [Synergistota bacterium]MDW8193064.1 TolC family protein [Synergistota bacterium]
EAHLEEVKARFNVGMTTKSELLRAETALANAELDIIRAENILRTAELNLKFAIGLDRDEEIEIKEELVFSSLRGELKSYIEEAFSKRPELLSMSHAIEALRANEKIALANYSPQVYFSGNYQWSGDTFPPKSDSWSVALILSVNLFDGGETKGKVNEIRANISKFLAAFENIKKSIALQVESAYLSVKEAEKRIKVAEAYVDKAFEDFKMAEEEYKAGVGTTLNVLDAQTSWKQMKNNYIQALYDANVAVAKLILAIGRDRF